MAVESCTARVAGRLSESALRLRQPARRFAGSVRTALCACSIIFAAYGLLIGSVYLWRPYHYHGAGNLLQTGAGFAFMVAIIDMALIFGVLVRKDNILHYIVCAALALHAVCVPLSLCVIVGLAINGSFDMPLWEIPHLGACLLQLGLMYCLLVELRGDPLPPLDPAPPADGWLKNNLTHASAAHAPASDDALLKVLSDNDHPAVFTPSSCTTAAPVHPAHVNINNSGPPSSSTA